MFEPLAGATRLDNGTIYLEIVDKDVEIACSEEKARKQFELIKEDGTLEEEDGSDELRVQMTKSSDEVGNIEVDMLREKMEAEFASFLKGEKYDYVTDMRKAFAYDLAKPMSYKIFKTLPDYVFWDIKKPRQEELETYDNPYNSGRAHPHVNFFETRKLEDWHNIRKDKRFLDAGVSRYGNY